jgi:caffeoyl-CoA O-methyltransferase
MLTQSHPPAKPITPTGILAAELKAIADQLASLPNLPADLGQRFDRACHLAAGLDPYLEACTSPESADLTHLATKTAEEGWEQRFDEGTTTLLLQREMVSGHVQGQALKMFVRMVNAKRVLEIGMFTGYSALAMAEALPEDGEVITCEIDPFVIDFARSVFQTSAAGRKIRIMAGSALDTLDQLAAQGDRFDFVFMDANKSDYVNYFHRLLDKDLLTATAVIAVDNTLLQGQAYLPAEERTGNGAAIADFNQVVAADPRVEQVLLPLRDGLTLIRRVS